MSVQQWKKLYNTLEVRKQPSLPPLPKPTELDLKEYEEKSGLRLPNSYRTFIKVFGPGELARRYQIMSPGHPDRMPNTDLLRFNEDTKRRFNKTTLAFFKDKEQIERLVYFSRTDAGDLIGWDPEDETDSRNHEYGIYKVGRDPVANKIAATFEEFIRKVCLGEKSVRPPKRNEPELGSRKTFDPTSDVTDYL